MGEDLCGGEEGDELWGDSEEFLEDGGRCVDIGEDQCGMGDLTVGGAGELTLGDEAASQDSVVEALVVSIAERAQVMVESFSLDDVAAFHWVMAQMCTYTASQCNVYSPPEGGDGSESAYPSLGYAQLADLLHSETSVHHRGGDGYTARRLAVMEDCARDLIDSLRQRAFSIRRGFVEPFARRIDVGGLIVANYRRRGPFKAQGKVLSAPLPMRLLHLLPPLPHCFIVSFPSHNSVLYLAHLHLSPSLTLPFPRSLSPSFPLFLSFAVSSSISKP